MSETLPLLEVFRRCAVGCVVWWGRGSSSNSLRLIGAMLSFVEWIFALYNVLASKMISEDFETRNTTKVSRSILAAL